MNHVATILFSLRLSFALNAKAPEAINYNPVCPSLGLWPHVPTTDTMFPAYHSRQPPLLSSVASYPSLCLSACSDPAGTLS